MKISILSLFPSMFLGPFETSMIKKAKDMGVVDINIHDLRGWATDKHKTVDDRPYGGGPGMVIKVDVVANALKDIKKRSKARVIMLSPQGVKFNQKKAQELCNVAHLVLLAGHYEGFDERIHEHLVDEEISIGDYVLTGGELPAMVITDAIVRLLPGVLEAEARENESFSDGATLDYPVYTRPENYKGWGVPEVLMTGDHKKIGLWRKEAAITKTLSRKR